jgi:hypothetical protein
MAGNAERRLPPMVPPNLDADGSATTYPDARAALGGNATKMVDLCLTMACDDAMSNLLNMFLYPYREVALPQYKADPLPFPI